MRSHSRRQISVRRDCELAGCVFHWRHALRKEAARTASEGRPYGAPARSRQGCRCYGRMSGRARRKRKAPAQEGVPHAERNGGISRRYKAETTGLKTRHYEAGLKRGPYTERNGGMIRPGLQRSEERRVGKECRSRWSPYH